MIKAIVTDCFGVLYNDILKDMLDRHNVSNPDIKANCFRAAHMSDLGDLPLETFFQQLSQLTGISLEDVNSEMSDTSRLNTELMKTLVSLKSSYKLGMISDVDVALLKPFLLNGNLENLFDKIVTSSEIHCTKPQRQIFDVMVEKLGVQPSEVIFIDNSKANVQAAATLGMEAILFVSNELLDKKLGDRI